MQRTGLTSMAWHLQCILVSG